MKVKSKITQDEKFDKSMCGFIPKEPGEVDLVGKFFVRKASKHGHEDPQNLGDGTMFCGVMFGLDWGDQKDDEMWECEVNIKPIKKFKTRDWKKNRPPGHENYAGLTIDQVMGGQWGNGDNYDKIQF